MATKSGQSEGVARAGYFHGKRLGLAAVCALAVVGLTLLVVANVRLGLDESLTRAIQGVNIGPLGGLLTFYEKIGGPWAIEAIAVVFTIVLALNWRAWRALLAGVSASGWYYGLTHVVTRQRPGLIALQQHAGGSSYPSGHVILFTFFAVILMVAVGMKYLPRRWQWLGWLVAALFVGVGGFSRVYLGGHWPSDVLASVLIGTGWLSLVLAVRWISDPVFEDRRKNKPSEQWQGV